MTIRHPGVPTPPMPGLIVARVAFSTFPQLRAVDCPKAMVLGLASKYSTVGGTKHGSTGSDVGVEVRVMVGLEALVDRLLGMGGTLTVTVLVVVRVGVGMAFSIGTG